MVKTLLQKNSVLILIIFSALTASAARIILKKKGDSFYHNPGRSFLFLYTIQNLCIGMISLSIMSILQKMVLGVSLAMIGFTTPLLMGGAYGVILGILFFKVQKKNTELKRAVSHAEYNKKRYKQLFDFLPCGAEIISRGGEILDCSVNTSRFLGYRREELIGHNLADFIAEEERGKLKVKLKALDNPAAPFNPVTEVKIRQKNGEYKSILRSSSILRTESDTPVLLCVNTDITSLKKIENEKMDLSRRLSHSQRLEALGNLAGGIAHDFNNILAPIIGFSEMLLENLPEKSPDADKVERILQAGKRGRELTTQILNFSRHSSVDITVIDLKEVLEETVKLSRAAIPLEVEIQLVTPVKSCLIKAAPSRIHQVCMNLITNAYHAIEPEKGCITLSLQEISEQQEQTSVPPAAGDNFILKVKDTGCGIEPAIKEKIFEPFFTTKEKGKGTGIGLSIVYSVVRELKGEIRIDSSPGEGTEISIFLPTYDQIRQSENPPDYTVIHPDDNKRNITVDKILTHFEKEIHKN